MPSYLAPELVANIASFLDPNTLLDFRLASKEYRQASEPTLLEHHFTTRRHLYTLKSLHGLLEICQCPHLVKRLKMIEILQPDNGVYDGSSTVQPYGPPGNIVWESWVQDSQATREHDATLRAILRNLKQQNITLELSVRSCAKPDEDRPYGFKPYRRPWKHDNRYEIGEDIMIYSHDLCDLAGHRLAIAISDSEFPLKALTLRDICQPSLSNQSYGVDARRLSKSFFTALSSMKSLESISLLFSRDPSEGHLEEPLSAIAEALKPLPLSYIKLRHVSGSMETLVALLSQHETTLRQLSFEDVGIVGGQHTWEIPLLRMRSIATLQQVSLRQLCETVEEETVCCVQDSGGLTSWVFGEAADTVVSGIAKLIDHVDFAMPCGMEVTRD
jgi:hypothetical protein